MVKHPDRLAMSIQELPPRERYRPVWLVTAWTLAIVLPWAALAGIGWLVWRAW